MRPRISLRGSVRPSVRPSIRNAVGFFSISRIWDKMVGNGWENRFSEFPKMSQNVSKSPKMSNSDSSLSEQTCSKEPAFIYLNRL